MTPRELVTIRRNLGYTQEEMAEELGVSRQHLCKLETAAAPITATLSLAARYLSEHPTPDTADSPLYWP